ncbi:MAG: hypothetical protein IMF18_04620, partial [Proteobacteria bacterium]|nr:hypothetical protein [Pseudomonadota bacterium]
MDKEDIRTLAADPNLIKGIYNYCDRWCERCPFTSRCLNFTISNQQFADPETQDVSNEAFWQKLSETFQMTLDMVKEMAEREGIDLDSLDIEEDAEQDRLKEESTENDRCCRAAKVYAEMVEDWFDSARDLFGQEEDESNIEAQLEIPDVSPLENDTSFEEATHVIRWYQHQIYVKL